MLIPVGDDTLGGTSKRGNGVQPLIDISSSGMNQILGSSVSKTPESMRADILRIHELNSSRITTLNSLQDGLEGPGEEREILSQFLLDIGIPETKETLYIAYYRIAMLRDDGLLSYLDKQDMSTEDKDAIITRAYIRAQQYNDALHRAIIGRIDEDDLLTPFYRALMRGAHDIGQQFNTFYKAWRARLLLGVNRTLEADLGSQENIIAYLSQHDLFDLGHDRKMADRSYSILERTADGYIKKSYSEAFPQEIGAIVGSIKTLIGKLQIETDDVYQSKSQYIDYLSALIVALGETDTDQLITKWSEADTAWMKIQTPFQLTHPFETYEDPYRRTVSPEWDLRIENPGLFESTVQGNMSSMFERIASEKGLDPDSSVARLSRNGLDNTRVYVSAPILYYAGMYNGLATAQVIPNDKKVSQLHGKKIFSFAANLLKSRQNKPMMQSTRLIFSEDIIAKRKESTNSAGVFYALQDIVMTGHEYGHTLWRDSQSDTDMNISGNLKNIEEWKATTSGLMAFFDNPNQDLKENVVIDIIMIAVGNIDWMKADDVYPYYCEGLIHLELLFASGMISVDESNRVQWNYDEDTYARMESLYRTAYSNLVDIYLQRRDASEFLDQYTIIEEGYRLPRNEAVRAYAKIWYKAYMEHGNTIEEVDKK